jgi:molybdopterin-containing oxidoreductase family iron-sulfur binding subunit
MNKTPKARYGMVVDIDKCHGCGSCVVACAIENNVPPPPASGSNPRTGVSWLRVARLETPGRVHFIPVMCQQCEHETPCASVCPQNAVELDPATGIVGQISQRCLGCRYCMAACPYHARSFNWADPQWPAGMERTLNPQVSTRARGTVEKCNFCHGRWHAAREKAAASTGEPVAYTPACVEACPSQAIEFVDLVKDQPDGFRMLESLDTGAKVYYRTQNAELKKELQS